MLKRKTYLEFVRIIACLSVIMVHAHFYNNNISIKLIIGRCGVPLFFMITGYIFFASDHNYLKLLKKLLKKYILPLSILITFTVVFSDWILGKATLFYCLKSIDFLQLFKSNLSILLLQFSDYKGLLGHLWFFKDYLYIMILYPMLKKVLQKDDDSSGKICRRILMILIFIHILIVDINDLTGLNLTNTPLFLEEIIINILIGFEIYLNKNIFIAKKTINIIFGLVVSSFGLLLRKYTYGLNPDLYWASRDTIPTIIYSTGLFILLANIGLYFNQNKVINFIADKTYGIYLIHVIIINKLQTTTFYKNLSNNVINFSWTKQFLLEIILSIIIFIISLIIVSIIKKVITLFIKKLKYSE